MGSTHSTWRAPDSVHRTPRALAVTKTLLTEGSEVVLRMRGRSMGPLFPTGSLVHFRPGLRPALGDVVLLEPGTDLSDQNHLARPAYLAPLADAAAPARSAGLVAHRIIAIREGELWTKGDAVERADGPFRPNEVLACATSAHGTLRIPLRNWPARAIGLVVSRLYPDAARGTRALLRLVRRFFGRSTEVSKGFGRKDDHDGAASAVTTCLLPKDRCTSRPSLELWFRSFVFGDAKHLPME